MYFTFKKEWFQSLEKPLNTKNFVVDEITVSSNGKTLTFKSIADYNKYIEAQFLKQLENESKGFITVKLSGIAQLKPSNKFINFIKNSVCIHQWEYFFNEEWNPNFKCCSKCEKTVYDYSKLKDLKL